MLHSASIGQILWDDLYNGMWNVRGLYRAGSLKTVANELTKYNLDPVAVQEVR
jgi:hypothetical protein